MNATRTVFLRLHVAGGLLGLLVGLFAFRLPETRQFRVGPRRAYATQRIVFSVLIGLAAVILLRLFLAFRLARRQPVGFIVGGVMLNRYKREIVPGPIGGEPRAPSFSVT